MQPFQHISIADVAEQKDDLVIADIRDAGSFQSAHMEGAINLSNDNLAAFMEATPKSAPVVVVCYHGVSSQQAAQFLAGQGYEKVYSMDGGFEGWRIGQPVVSD